MTAHDIICVLNACRFPLSSESLLQAAIEEEFDARDVEHVREHRLSAEDRIDFFCPPGVGIECKVKSSKMALYRQVQRYAKHDSISELILVTNVPMGMPGEVEGKPVYVVNLAKAWL